MSQQAKQPLPGILVIFLAVSCVTGIAQAQQWPARAVRLVVPFPTGGGTDAFARPLAIKLSAQFGQQVIIELRSDAYSVRQP